MCKKYSPDSNVIKDLQLTMLFLKNGPGLPTDDHREPGRATGNFVLVRNPDLAWSVSTPIVKEIRMNYALGGRSSAAMRRNGWKQVWSAILKFTVRAGISVPRRLGTEVLSSSSINSVADGWPPSNA